MTTLREEAVDDVEFLRRTGRPDSGGPGNPLRAEPRQGVVTVQPADWKIFPIWTRRPVLLPCDDHARAWDQATEPS
jgi:hypothetical protein